MRGEAVITFDEPFQYSENGRFEHTNSITVRAPGLGKRHVHQIVQTYVQEAFIDLQAKRAAFDAAGGKQDEKPAALPNLDDEPAAAEADKAADDPMMMWNLMQAGLGTTKIVRFYDYLLAEMTNSPKLATVGPNGTPITESVWESVVEANGLDAINRVFGTFVGFFIERQESKKTSGSATSTTSSSPPKAVSLTNTRGNSRSSKS